MTAESELTILANNPPRHSSIFHFFYHTCNDEFWFLFFLFEEAFVAVNKATVRRNSTGVEHPHKIDEGDRRKATTKGYSFVGVADIDFYPCEVYQFFRKKSCSCRLFCFVLFFLVFWLISLKRNKRSYFQFKHP